MKKAVLIIFLVGFCKVFAAFEFDILGQLTASINFPIAMPTNASSTKSSAAANFGVALQIGNQFSIPPKNLRSGRPMEAPIFNRGNQYSAKELKGVSVFFDLRIEQETIALGNNDITTITNFTNETTKNMARVTGLNLGAGITTKFIFGSVNSLVPRDTILGFSLGAKLLLNLFGVDAAMLGVGALPVITPYIDLFVEQRFFVARKFALVGGINIGADIMIAFLNENLRDFFVLKSNVFPIYPSLNIGFSLGLHFGH